MYVLIMSILLMLAQVKSHCCSAICLHYSINTKRSTRLNDEIILKQMNTYNLKRYVLLLLVMGAILFEGV
jgi:hypothetical protein